MKPFQPYVEQLHQLLSSARCDHSAPTVRASISVALDGGPSIALRRLVPIDHLRSAGAFFTGSALSRRLVRLIAPTFDRHSVILDPACGAGDLLLACAEALPNAKGGIAAEAWSRQLEGRDIADEFVAAARIRLELLLLTTYAAGSRVSVPRFRRIRSGCGMEDRATLQRATHIVLNPPFTLVEASSDCEWGSGAVNSAGIFVEACIRHARSGTRVAAILPDVLRSGARYQHWREFVARRATVDRVVLTEGQFDSSTDVNVFLLALTVKRGGDAVESRNSLWRLPRRPLRERVGQYFTVGIGPVVDYRDPHEGHSWPFIRSKDLPAWGRLEHVANRRRYLGRVVVPPFVAVRRTSRPDAPFRAVATIVRSDGPVAVENHLLVLRPKDDSPRTCEELLALLSMQKTNDWLNRRIRCRHLTVGALADLPWWRDR